MARIAMTPSEFDANCRLLEHACPWLWATSGYRGAEHNAAVGGSSGSDHLIAMARDYGADNEDGLNQAAVEARKLGFWLTVHDRGSGIHLHVQGTKPGPLPEWWTAKFGG